LTQTGPATTAADRVAERVLDGAPGAYRLDLSDLQLFRDRVYELEPALFDGTELLSWGKTAFLWMPLRPDVSIQVDGGASLSEDISRVIPGIRRSIGSDQANHSTLEFWRRELGSRRNLVSFVLVAVLLGSLSVVGGSQVLANVASTLSVFFAVTLPTIPLFFRPVGQIDAVPFLISGRLARWQMAERQMFGVASAGFLASIGLNASSDAVDGAFGADNAIYWIVEVACALFATWLLLSVITYAIPLIHSLEVSNAIKAYSKLRRRPNDPPKPKGG
jgi:hypothetical protein